MTNDLSQLSKPQKKEAAKQLVLHGYTLRQVENILGIDHSTAARYAEEPTPDEMRQFTTVFDTFIREQKQKGLELGMKRLLELIPRERRIDQVVKGMEYMEGKQTDNGNIKRRVVAEEFFQ